VQKVSDCFDLDLRERNNSVCLKKSRRIINLERSPVAIIVENNWVVQQPFGRQQAYCSFGQKLFTV
jgi:hypothetical protein